MPLLLSLPLYAHLVHCNLLGLTEKAASHNILFCHVQASHDFLFSKHFNHKFSSKQKPWNKYFTSR